MNFGLDLYNIRETQDERTRRRLYRFNRRIMRRLARNRQQKDLFGV